MTDGPFLVVGLGNPGEQYAGNRHNVGFMVVDRLAGRAGERLRPHRRGRAASRAEVADVRLDGVRLVLATPQSFMNDSGGPAATLSAYFDIPPARCIVVHDELDLPLGAIRLKFGGGDNGHNGLRSLRRSWGTGDFFRIRVGVGRPPGRQDPADFVLRDFPRSDRSELDLELENAADAAVAIAVEGLERAQNRFNG